MRICFLASADSIHTQRWVKYFADKGHEVYLISPRPFGHNSVENVNLHVLKRFSPRLRVTSFVLNWLSDRAQVRKLIRKIEPDILDAHYIGDLASAGVASGFHPLVLTAWGSDIMINPKQSLLRRILTKHALKRADSITSVSLALKEEVIKLGAAPNKIEVIPMSVETQKFKSSLRSDTLLRELGVAGSPVVISTRSLKPVYDVETLIRAVPVVLEHVPDSMFIIAGEGEQRDYLKTLAQSMEVSDSIRFVGWIPNSELPSYLASSDVYVSTSLSDGTSVSLLEALACELAPVVTDIPANRPWVNDGENGFLIPVREYEMLAEGIIRLLEDEGLRKKFGEAGRAIVIEKAEHEEQMTRVERIYEELICAKF